MAFLLVSSASSFPHFGGNLPFSFSVEISAFAFSTSEKNLQKKAIFFSAKQFIFLRIQNGGARSWIKSH